MSSQTIIPSPSNDIDIIEEKFILSILIFGNVPHTSVHPTLEDFFFTIPEHRSIFSWLKQQTGSIQFPLLFYHLVQQYQDNSYVLQIMNDLQNIFNRELKENHAEAINIFATNLAKKRQFTQFSQQIHQKIAKTSYTNPEEIDSFFINCQNQSTEIYQSFKPVKPKFRKLKEIAIDFELREEQQKSSVVKTPFTELNALLQGGLKEKNVVVIGARPNIGKTTFAANLCLYFALHELTQEQEVSFWSLEDHEDSIYKKMLLRLMQSSDNESNRKVAHEKLAKLNINITDHKEFEIEKIVYEIRKIHQICPQRIIILDYLNKITCTNQFLDRLSTIRCIMNELRDLATDCNNTVILLTQINRQSETREDKTPRISELKESGCIEEAADIILLLHRDYPSLACRKMPIENNKVKEHKELLQKERNRAQIILAKNKEGLTANIEAIYWPEGGGFFPYSYPLIDQIMRKNLAK